MNGYSRLVLVGNLTKDPEIRYTQSGKAVCAFTLAVNSGREGDATVFLDCQAWEKRGEAIGQYVRKGHPLMVDGRLRQENWEKDGQKRTSMELDIDEIGPTLRFVTVAPLSGGAVTASADEPAW